MANWGENNDKGTHEAPRVHMPTNMANALLEAYPESSSYNAAMRAHLDGSTTSVDIKALYGIGCHQTLPRIQHRNTSLSADKVVQQEVLNSTLRAEGQAITAENNTMDTFIHSENGCERRWLEYWAIYIQWY